MSRLKNIIVNYNVNDIKKIDARQRRWFDLIRNFIAQEGLEVTTDNYVRQPSKDAAAESKRD